MPAHPPQSPGPWVLVDLDVLISPEEEAALASAVRASVAAVAGEAALGAARWGGALGGEDLVRQWGVENDAPLGGRRVRRLTMGVDGGGVAASVDEIAWAAIDAVCPTAREEDRLLDAGRGPVPASPDRYPWSSGTRALGGAPRAVRADGAHPHRRRSAPAPQGEPPTPAPWPPRRDVG